MTTFYINFGSLESWLALKPLRALTDTTGISLDWRPLLGSLGNVTGTHREDDPLAEYKLRRAKARQNDAKRIHERMCALLGISPEAGKREIDPLNASLGLLWLSEQDVLEETYHDYAKAVYERAFVEAGDVESVEGVISLLDSLHVGRDGFNEFAMTAGPRLENEGDELLESGILYAPVFVVEGEIFHGREHLPLITWMVTGREGAPPV